MHACDLMLFKLLYSLGEVCCADNTRTMDRTGKHFPHPRITTATRLPRPPPSDVYAILGPDRGFFGSGNRHKLQFSFDGV